MSKRVVERRRKSRLNFLGRSGRLWALTVVSVLSVAVGLLLHGTGVMRWMELPTLDARFSVRGTDPPPRPVVVVGVDEDTLYRLGPRPPYDRRVYARVLDRLHDSGARLIAYDLSAEPNAGPSDRALYEAAGRARPVVFGTTTILESGQTDVLGGDDRLAAIGARAGSAFLHTDTDGVVRRTVARDGGLPILGAVVAARLTHKPPAASSLRGGVIDFAGSGGTVPAVSLASVWDGTFDRRVVRGKIVVLGDTARVLQDVHPTPFGPMTGPEIHANIIATVLRNFPLRDAPGLVRVLTVVALALLVPLVAVHFGSLATAAAGAAAVVLWLMSAQLAFNAGMVLEVVPPAAALLCSTAGALSVSGLAERRERQRLRTLFAAHSPDLVQQVLAGKAGTLSPTAIVAGYQLEEIVGQGGMGVVYRATQLSLGRQIALKLVAHERAADPSFRARFRQESRIAAAIEHPSVIPVYEAGDDDGLLFIAMRLVQGVDLGRLVGVVGPLPADRAVDVVEQVAGALDAAHARNLVHRDIKPANVLLTADDPPHAYLTDFGLARHVGAGAGLTDPGAWVGTLDYLAPEQLLGQPVDARTDIYALAGLLYYCLAGYPPFPRENEAAKMYAHLHDSPPSLDVVRPELPAGLSIVIKRGLAKDPLERPPTAQSFARGAATAIGHASHVKPRAPGAVAPTPDDRADDPTMAS